MPSKQKPVKKVPIQADGKDSSIRRALDAWGQGERLLLLQIWDCYSNRVPPQLYDALRSILEHASMPVPPMPKREPHRPKGSQLHDDAQRAEIVRTVDWLRKVNPRMTKTHARKLAADFHKTADRQVKKYCLDQSRRLR